MIKITFDFILSLVGLIFLSPILLLVAILIKLDSHGPVFFRQNRVGLEGKVFKIHKFRSMYLNSINQGNLTIGIDNRITRLGKFLRKYKIDELPQLIDVLLGKMSLVGPRPEVQEFINFYPDVIKEKVLSVRPGITDIASILMIDENNTLGEHKDPRQAYIDVILPIKLKCYVEYIDKKSIWLDIKIILLTIKKIVLR